VVLINIIPSLAPLQAREVMLVESENARNVSSGHASASERACGSDTGTEGTKVNYLQHLNGFFFKRLNKVLGY